ncbi:MAG TPA: hypothetical protein VFT87_00095 [Candidatus Saccharimonadales bacterium]|nr:hypothetical protein [Candidatus Saccharimonadales bacterium]
MNTFETTTKSMYKALKEAPADSFRLAFVDYCRKALALEKQYNISKQLVAEVIAGAMFLEGADDFQIDEITSVAGLLEVPAYYSEQKWQHLLALIEELANEES